MMSDDMDFSDIGCGTFVSARSYFVGYAQKGKYMFSFVDIITSAVLNCVSLGNRGSSGDCETEEGKRQPRLGFLAQSRR